MRAQVMLGAGVLVLVSLLMAGCGQGVADNQHTGKSSGGVKVSAASPCCGGSHDAAACPEAKKCECAECKCCDTCKVGGSECKCEACACCDSCLGKKAPVAEEVQAVEVAPIEDAPAETVQE